MTAEGGDRREAFLAPRNDVEFRHGSTFANSSTHRRARAWIAPSRAFPWPTFCMPITHQTTAAAKSVQAEGVPDCSTWTRRPHTVRTRTAVRSRRSILRDFRTCEAGGAATMRA